MKSEQNKNKQKKNPIKPISIACRWQWGRGRAVVKAEQTTEDEDNAKFIFCMEIN